MCKLKRFVIESNGRVPDNLTDFRQNSEDSENKLYIQKITYHICIQFNFSQNRE
jgi:hypothetical protein